MAESWMPETSELLTPYLTVRDAQAAIDFYEKAFGFTVTEKMPDEKGGIMHVGMSYRGKMVVMFAPESVAPSKAPVSSGVAEAVGLYLYCEDADAMFQRAVAAGGTGERPVEDMFWGDRMGSVRDPDGYLWSVGHKLPDSEDELPGA